MRLDVRVHHDLPALAWAAISERSTENVLLLCGSGVEFGDDWWFEGAWSGAFGECGFDKADVVCGSGGKIVEGELVLVPPTHTLESIFFAERKTEITFSNSICFLLCLIDDHPRPDFRFYYPLFKSAKYGLDNYCRMIKTAKGGVERRFYHPLSVKSGEINRSATAPEAPNFDSFDNYYTYLRNSAGGLCDNARSSERSAGYEPLTAISSGYDSPAVASVVRQFACAEAFTFAQARGSEGQGADDSGTEIGSILGFHVREETRDGYLQCSATEQAQFFASGLEAEELLFLPLARRLSGAMLFTGFHGDKAWDMGNHSEAVPLFRGDTSGSSFSEFRLSSNFVHCPLPFFGALRQDQLNDISRSSDMAEWSVGGPYDRPVPRRIAESAGVPREFFGNVKMAASSPVGDRRMMSDAAAGDYEEFLDDSRLPTDGADRILRPVRPLAEAVWNRAYRRRNGVLRITGLDMMRLQPSWEQSRLRAGNYTAEATFKRHFFTWGVERTRRRYESTADSVR